MAWLATIDVPAYVDVLFTHRLNIFKSHKSSPLSTTTSHLQDEAHRSVVSLILFLLTDCKFLHGSLEQYTNCYVVLN